MRKGLDKGFLLLYDWMPALKALSKSDIGELVLALIDYQREGAELPEFSNDLTKVFAEMILPTLRRRLNGKGIATKDMGYVGGELTEADGGDTCNSDDDAECDDEADAPEDDAYTDDEACADEGAPLGTTVSRCKGAPNGSSCIGAHLGTCKVTPHSRAEHSRAKQSRAKKSKAKKSEKESTSPRKAPQGADTCVRGGESGGGDDGFSRFWSAYPKKVGKAAAERAFEKLRPGEELICSMLSAIERQKSSDQWRRDSGQFIPHPSTWLCGRRWEDETSRPFSRICTEYDTPSSWDDIF